MLELEGLFHHCKVRTSMLFRRGATSKDVRNQAPKSRPYPSLLCMIELIAQLDEATAANGAKIIINVFIDI